MVSDEYVPDAADLALMRFLGLLPGHAGSDGHYDDPDVDEFAWWQRFDHENDPDCELMRAALFARGWRLGQRILWPLEAVDPVRVLLVLLAATRCSTGPHLTPDGADLTGLPSSPAVHARAILTAAPPACVCCPAGATG